MQAGPQDWYGAFYKKNAFAREHTISTTALVSFDFSFGALLPAVELRSIPWTVVKGAFSHPHVEKKSFFLVHVAEVLKKTLLAVCLASYAVGGRLPALS